MRCGTTGSLGGKTGTQTNLCTPKAPSSTVTLPAQARRQFDDNRREQRRTSVGELSTDWAYLSDFSNGGEQPQNRRAAFARRRSGVRIPSAPLLKGAHLQVKLKKISSPTASQALVQQRGAQQRASCKRRRPGTVPFGNLADQGVYLTPSSTSPTSSITTSAFSRHALVQCVLHGFSGLAAHSG